MLATHQGVAAGLCATIIILGSLAPVAAERPTGADAKLYLPIIASDNNPPAPTCQAAFTPVSTPLTDLGDAEYVRMGVTPT